MRGAGEPQEEDNFGEDPFEPGMMDLSNHARWSSVNGSMYLELALRDRLFERMVEQEIGG